MFTFPTEEEALAVRDACAQGDRDKACRLYKQAFDDTKWGYPGYDSEHYAEFTAAKREVTASMREVWKPGWLTSAARGDHADVLCWLTSLDPEDLDCFKFIAKGYLARLRSRHGTVGDALGACGEGWWPYHWWDDDEHPYKERTCSIAAWRFDTATRNYVFKNGFNRVNDDFEVTAEFTAAYPEAVFFSHKTPDFVLEEFKFHQNDLVSYVIRRAHDYYDTGESGDAKHGADSDDSDDSEESEYSVDSGLESDEGARLVDIACELVEIGFEFRMDVFFLMDKSVNHDKMWRLMHKMIRIHGGREHVPLKLQYYDKKRRVRSNVLLIRCVVRLLVASARARKRAWEPSSAHVAALAANFGRNVPSCRT